VALKSYAEELAPIAQDTDAEVIRGPGRSPGREGRFDVAEFEIEELLYKLKDQKVVLIIAPLGPTEELPVICGLCGTPYGEDECPTCKKEREGV